MPIPEDLLREVWQYPLGKPITGRRSRRFGLGMQIPEGPLAFKSRHPPLPLSEAETAILLCASTGVTRWDFGIPYSTASPAAYPTYTTRFTGRTFPTGAGVGTPEVFYTDDRGTYLVKTRDLAPEVEQPAHGTADFQRILQQVRSATVKPTQSNSMGIKYVAIEFGVEGRTVSNQQKWDTLVLLAGDVASLLVLVAMAVLLLLHVMQVWQIFLLAFLNGIVFSMSWPTRATVVHEVVGPGDVAKGVAIYTTVFSISQLAGPPLAGYLMDISPDQFGWAFLAAAAFLVPSIAFLLPLGFPDKPAALQGERGPSVMRSITEGLTHIKASSLLTGLVLMSVVIAVFGLPYQASCQYSRRTSWVRVPMDWDCCWRQPAAETSPGPL